jgi:acid phosphatase family membrane protein YuiD
MSKPVARVTLFVLISLVLIAATSVSVRGWLDGAREASGVQAHIVNGLQTNFNHDRSTVTELESLQMQSESQFQSGKGHGCESEAQVSPQD